MRKLRMFLAIIATVVIATVGLAAPATVQGKAFGSNGEIAFTRYDPTIGDTVTLIVNPDGGNPRLLFSGVATGVPHWSPDGTELALQAGFVDGIVNPCPPCAASTIIVNPDTGSYRALPPPDPSKLATDCSIWSPDATHFACAGENDFDLSVNGIYTIRSSDGGGLTRITAAGGGLTDIPIDYSPDGKQIVFGREDLNHNCTTRSALYVVNLDGSGLRRITPWGFCDDDGSWSPDGTKIAFASGERLGSIFIVHPDGTGLQQIPINVSGISGVGDVTWSPDGTKIAFILGVGRGSGAGPEGIYTANADGSNLQRVTSSPTFDHETDWGSHPPTT